MRAPALESLETLFERARLLPPPERGAFLASRTYDPVVRAELASLLAADDRAAPFFDRLASAVLAPHGWIDDAASIAAGGAAPGPGDRIGAYLVGALLGAGGMGVVYRARDTRLDRDVALKFLPAHLSADPAAKQRFLVEARAAAALNHPNVCAIHEVGEDAEGRLFLAMAYYRGETLKRKLERGPLPIEEALEVARQIARALDAAHARDIVHRDVKPGNVLVTGDGEVKLLDFGLAKLGDATLTAAGARMGTVAYMSPEQTRGSDVDARADLWSLGVVLYETLTGERPFRGNGDRLVIHSIRHDEPRPPSDVRDTLSGELDALVLRLLDRDPDRRGAALDWLLADQPDLATASMRREARLRRGGWVAASAVAVSVAGLLAANVSGGDASAVRSLAVLPLVNGTGDSTQAHYVAGFHEALLTELERFPELTVTARASALEAVGADRPVSEVAARLGVDAVVEGTVTRDGDSVRFDATLVDGESEEPLWAGSYASRVTEALSLPREAASELALAVEVPAGEVRDRTAVRAAPGAEAQDAYLSGVYELRGPATEASHPALQARLRRAIGHLERAVALAPDWAAAHAKLGLAYHWLASTDARIGTDYSIAEEYFPKAKDAALRAVALDETEAQGYASLGYVLYMHERDWVGAERALRRAVTLEPSAANQTLLGLYLTAAGRAEEAIPHLREAEARDPLSRRAVWALAHAYGCAGRHEEKIARLVELTGWLADPRSELRGGNAQIGPGNLHGARLQIAYARSALGEHDRAMAGMEEVVAATDSSLASVASLAYVYASAGRRVEATALVDLLDERDERWKFLAPEALVAVGEIDRAVGVFEEAAEIAPSVTLAQLRCVIGYPEIRRDPRILAVERELGMPD